MDENKILDGMADFENRISALENAGPYKRLEEEIGDPEEIRVLRHHFPHQHTYTTRQAHRLYLRMDGCEQRMGKLEKLVNDYLEQKKTEKDNSKITLGELACSKNEGIRRNAIGILKQLQRS